MRKPLSHEMDLLEKNFLNGVIDEKTYDSMMDDLIRESNKKWLSRPQEKVDINPYKEK